MRKIISITTQSECGDNYGYLFALCDDGTIWHKRMWIQYDEDWEWKRYPGDSIPQGEDPNIQYWKDREAKGCGRPAADQANERSDDIK